MSARVELKLLKVGSCRHCERMTLQGGRLTPVSFPALAALIIHPKRGPILFDTGYAAHFEHATNTFPERIYRWITPVSLPAHQTLKSQLNQFGFELDDVRMCFISHFHADHIAGLKDLSNAKFIAMRSDYSEIISKGRIKRLSHGLLIDLLPLGFNNRLQFAEDFATVALSSPWEGFGEGFDLLGDRSLIGIRLPGHSAGQMGLLLRDEYDREVFLCADACWSARAFRELRMPSVLARQIMQSWPKYRETIIQLNRLTNEHSELVILPSHCDLSLSSYQKSWKNQ